MKNEFVPLNQTQTAIGFEELVRNHPLPWERRGRAIFDAQGCRVNLVDPVILETLCNFMNTTS